MRQYLPVNMKILVVAALLSCAYAAPSGVALPAAAVPTIDPGDLQAAAIDAQVAAEDQARALTDAAQEFNEKVVLQNNEKVIESDSLVKEKTEEAFWAGEDKKWQTIDALKTAEAKLDGAVANSADVIAKSALGGIIIPTFVNPQLLPAPIVRSPIVPAAPIYPAPILPAPVLPSQVLPAPISPIIYATPGLVPKLEEKEKESVKTADLEKNKKQEVSLQPQPEPQKEAEKPLLKDGKPLEDNPAKPALPILPLAAAPAITLPQWVPGAPVYLPQPVFLKSQW